MDVRWSSSLLILTLGITGCGARGQAAPGHQASGNSLSSDNLNPGVLQAGWKTDFDKHVVPVSEIASGGPGKDGIPAIDRPKFAPVAATTFIKAGEPVLVVTIANQTHAYPYQIMIWHEIANDTVGGTPVAVTFCPLCGTGVAFDRSVGGQTTTFGTTGNLRNSDLVMYDRATETWWQQATGEGLVGTHAGDHLRFVSALTLSWDDVRRDYPQAVVLQRDTGYTRRYGENPYPGYDDINSHPFLFSGKADGRLPAMTRVLGVRADGRARAYPFQVLQAHGAINDSIGAQPAVVLYKPGVRSALDTQALADGRPVGTATAWDPRIEGRLLVFAAKGDGQFRDEQTGSSWNIAGTAISGSLAGRQLTPVVGFTSFWFAWAALDTTDIYRG